MSNIQVVDPNAQVSRTDQRRKRRVQLWTSIGGLWLVGLYFMLLGQGLVKPSDEAVQLYESKVEQAEDLYKEIFTAGNELQEAEYTLSDHKTWFWWWDNDKRQEVNKFRAVLNEKRAKYLDLLKQRDVLLDEAKAHLGLWSDLGVEESKKLFWESFNQGKVFARRQTFWDAVVQCLSSNEEGLVGRLLSLLLSTLINFTTGLTASLFIYLARLPWLIWRYRANLASAVGFFMVSSLGAVSVVTGYLGLLYGASAGVIYIAAVPAGRRLEGRGQRSPYLRQHQD